MQSKLYSLLFVALATTVVACSKGSGSATTDMDPGDGGPSDLPAIAVAITSPGTGLITTESSVSVSGTTQNTQADDILAINGAPASIDSQGNWSATVAIDQSIVLNSVIAELTRSGDQAVVRDRIVVLAGESVQDGDFSMESVALRINDTGLDQIEPLIGLLVGGDLDLGALVPVGTKLIDDECFIDTFVGCLGKATVKIDNPAPGFSNFAVDLDSRTDRALAEVAVQDLHVDVKLKGSGLVPDCGIEMNAEAAAFRGEFVLEPDDRNPSNVDVSLKGKLTIEFDGFGLGFDGICDAPIIGDIIQSFLPDVESLATDAIADFLKDPDGAGPLDDPISQAAQDALAGISITGPIGEALMADLDAPMFVVAEDTAGITIGSDGRIVTETLAEGAPDLVASYHIPTEFPVFGPVTPSGQLYGLAICVSPSFFNQLFKTTTEAGALATVVTEIEGEAITAALLSAFLDAYQVLPADQLLKLVIDSDVAPFLTGARGPSGELGELILPHIQIDIRSVDDDTLYNRIVVDAVAGLDLTIDPQTGELAPTIVPPALDMVQTFVLNNAIGADETVIVDALGPLLTSFLPRIAGAFDAFPLPDFFGLRIEVVETAREASFYSIYANLAATETD